VKVRKGIGDGELLGWATDIDLRGERFVRTVKEEEVNAKTYATIEEARADIGAFIENVYSRGRLKGQAQSCHSNPVSQSRGAVHTSR
jgi:hypothetical protein